MTTEENSPKGKTIRKGSRTGKSAFFPVRSVQLGHRLLLVKGYSCPQVSSSLILFYVDSWQDTRRKIVK